MTLELWHLYRKAQVNFLFAKYDICIYKKYMQDICKNYWWHLLHKRFKRIYICKNYWHLHKRFKRICIRKLEFVCVCMYHIGLLNLYGLHYIGLLNLSTLAVANVKEANFWNLVLKSWYLFELEMKSNPIINV